MQQNLFLVPMVAAPFVCASSKSASSRYSAEAKAKSKKLAVGEVWLAYLRGSLEGKMG
jgi:hypothetical protein